MSYQKCNLLKLLIIYFFLVSLGETSHFIDIFPRFKNVLDNYLRDDTNNLYCIKIPSDVR